MMSEERSGLVDLANRFGVTSFIGKEPLEKSGLLRWMLFRFTISLSSFTFSFRLGTTTHSRICELTLGHLPLNYLNRLSQLHGTSPGDLAEKLTEELRASGDLDLASPSFEDRMYVFLASLPSHILTVLLTFLLSPSH